MKKVLLIGLVILLLLATAGPAVAAGGGHGRGLGGGVHRQAGKGAGAGAGGYFTLTGVITAINGTDKTVTVYVQGGSRLTQPNRGQNLTLATDEATRFLMLNEDGTTTIISFADLAVEQKVSAAGKYADEVWLATRITVGADLIHYP